MQRSDQRLGNERPHRSGDEFEFFSIKCKAIRVFFRQVNSLLLVKKI